MPIRTVETGHHLDNPAPPIPTTPTITDLENRICTECHALGIEPTDDIITETKKYFNIGCDGWIQATGQFNTIREMLNHYMGGK